MSLLKKSVCDTHLIQLVECERLPKLLYTPMRGLVSLGQIALNQIVLLLDTGISHLFIVGGDTNVLESG